MLYHFLHSRISPQHVWQYTLGLKMHSTFALSFFISLRGPSNFFLHVRHLAKHLQPENRPEIQTTHALTTQPPAFVFWVIGSVCVCCTGPWELLLFQHYLIVAFKSVYSDHQCLSRNRDDCFSDFNFLICAV